MVVEPLVPAFTSAAVNEPLQVPVAVVGSPVNGTTTIAAGSLDDVINAMKAGTVYANVHTTANGGGEIRGQINPK